MTLPAEEYYGTRFENVWCTKDQKLLNEIVEAWDRVHAIPANQSGQERAKQVVYLVRNKNDEIIGISTAYFTFIPNLNNNLFVYRCMIFPGNNIPGLFTKITLLTIEYLESIHKSLNQKVIGILTEVENKSLQKLNLAVLPSGFVFIGYSKRGNPLRVYYFKGAKI